jgi:hypothetical protein
MLEKRPSVLANDFAFDDIDIDRANGGAVIGIPAAEKNAIRVALKKYRQRICRMRCKFRVPARIGRAVQ